MTTSHNLKEWTKIDISYEEAEEGKYFIFLRVGGIELGREEMFTTELSKLSAVKITLGNAQHQPGFIIRLVVLGKS